MHAARRDHMCPSINAGILLCGGFGWHNSKETLFLIHLENLILVRCSEDRAPYRIQQDATFKSGNYFVVLRGIFTEVSNLKTLTVCCGFNV